MAESSWLEPMDTAATANTPHTCRPFVICRPYFSASQRFLAKESRSSASNHSTAMSKWLRFLYKSRSNRWVPPWTWRLASMMSEVQADWL